MVIYVPLQIITPPSIKLKSATYSKQISGGRGASRPGRAGRARRPPSPPGCARREYLADFNLGEGCVNKCILVYCVSLAVC